MEEPPKQPSTAELVARINELETSHATLSSAFHRLAKQFAAYLEQANARGQLHSDYFDSLFAGQEDAGARIKNIEVTVFPNLPKDINRLFDITGESDNKPNPLDRREKKS